MENKKSAGKFKRKKEYALVNNKDMMINDIIGIHIDNFRLFKNQFFQLGKNITVVSGRNGTMKSTLMGLIAQPYRSEYLDVFGKNMETKFSNVFKLSSEKDTDDYLYHIQLNVNDNLLLEEPIPLYFQPGNEDTKYSQKDRHRLVPSGREKGDGYFNLPSVYINLKRLYPLIDSGKINRNEDLEYSPDERKFIGKFYQRILLKSDFDEFNKYAATSVKSKQPYGPGENSYYDVQSISSGEDNLSTFVDVLISFMRIYNQRQKENLSGLTGIFSIDEFEASLHPIAQANLFDFLLDWSRQYNVKILLNTHSLFLIQHIYLKHENKQRNKHIILNFIESDGESKLSVIKNPEYKLAYRELTLSNMEERNELLKVKILCEDTLAKDIIKKMLKKRIITSNIIFSHRVDDYSKGTPFTLLTQLCRNFPGILEETKSIVVVDAEVDISADIKYKRLMKIPSIYEYPFEKELVRYVLDLPTDHPLFKKLNQTKEMLKQNFSQFDIDLNPSVYDSDTNIKPFKNWYANTTLNKNIIVKYYLEDNETMVSEFRNTILIHINQIRKNNGFAPIEI